VKGNDGNLYVLLFDDGRADYELTMFQSPATASFLAHAGKRRRADGG
jgi:hypothetical protein